MRDAVATAALFAMAATPAFASTPKERAFDAGLSLLLTGALSALWCRVGELFLEGSLRARLGISPEREPAYARSQMIRLIRAVRWAMTFLAGLGLSMLGVSGLLSLVETN